MAAFTAGNIVVYRVGDGSAALGSGSTAVFLDEYSASGALVQTIALPTAAGGGNNPLTASGSASSEGELTTSGDGRYLLLTGYDAPTGVASIAGTTAAADPREVGIVDANGNVDTNTVLTGFSTGNNIRSVASADGTNIYVAGATGVGYTTRDSAAAPIALSTQNTRQIEVINGQVYASSSSGNFRVFTVGTGTPTSGTQTLTELPGVPTTGSPYGFFGANLNGAKAAGALPDTLYVADDTTGTGGITKYTLTNGSYTASGTVDMGGVTRGLTGYVAANGTVTLYTTDANGTTIKSVVDSSGFGGRLTATPTTVATAPANEAFRGIANAPTCFTTGTLIRTTRGDIPVEALAVGDLAVTATGGTRAISWIGQREMDCRRQAGTTPVRIRAGAFGDGLPRRDLRLSPGHPVLVGADEDGAGGHLVPIMCLINGTTIEREPVERVTYWHVELDQHDILLAEGLPAESYLDWGDRAFFEDAADHALANPDFVVPGLGARCRPVALDGAVVVAERRRLDAVFATSLDAMCRWPSDDLSLADVA